MNKYLVHILFIKVSVCIAWEKLKKSGWRSNKTIWFARVNIAELSCDSVFFDDDPDDVDVDSELIPVYGKRMKCKISELKNTCHKYI